MASGSGLDLATYLLCDPDEISSAVLHLGFLPQTKDVALIIAELLGRAVIQMDVMTGFRYRQKAG